jgi:hypothetical protein
MIAMVGVPLSLDLWADDDGRLLLDTALVQVRVRSDAPHPTGDH